MTCIHIEVCTTLLWQEIELFALENFEEKSKEIDIRDITPPHTHTHTQQQQKKNQADHFVMKLIVKKLTHMCSVSSPAF